MAVSVKDARGLKTAALYDAGGNPLPLPKRRWDSASTTRLNSAHWESARDESVNVPLQANLATIRARCMLEKANNPTLAGVIDTHANDVVGPMGPSLQVQSRRKGYNQALEAVWSEWWNERSDIANRTHGPDWLKLCVKNLWPCGEYTAKLVNDPRVKGLGEISLRIQRVAPRRLQQPFMMGVNAVKVLMGVEFDEYGAPIKYYIANESLTGLNITTGYDEVRAEYFIHEFIQEEDDQVRGVPWISCVLDAAGQARDFDTYVLDAAQEAANNSYVVYTDSPDLEALEVPTGDVEIQRKQARFLPPGYKATQMTPQQPSTNYVEFRAERQRDLGRPVGMPLMKVRLDSSKHNYSSARFDGQVYQRGIQSLQRWIERRTLNRLVRLVQREAELLGLVGQRPKDVRFEWTWPVLPHVDPTKERAAERMELEDGTNSFSNIVVGKGLDPEAVIDQRKRDQELFESAGLETPKWMKGETMSGAGRPAESDESEESDNSDNSDDEAEAKDEGNS